MFKSQMVQFREVHMMKASTRRINTARLVIRIFDFKHYHKVTISAHRDNQCEIHLKLIIKHAIQEKTGLCVSQSIRESDYGNDVKRRLGVA